MTTTDENIPNEAATADGPSRVGLVLAGAVARGSYEAGALRVVLPALSNRVPTERPTVLIGTSSGALNAAFLASRAHLGPEVSTKQLVDLWERIGVGSVLDGLVTMPLRFRSRLKHGLFEVQPLRELIEDELFGGRNFQDNIADGHLDALAVVATASSTGWSRVFVQDDGTAILPRPDYRKGIDYVRPDGGITVDHLLASASVPALFPPVRIKANCHFDWYVDGGMRLNTPIKPALALGSNRVVVIATESAKYGPRHTQESPERPDLDDAILQFFQGTLADRLIEDVYRLGRTNAFIAECAKGPGSTPQLGLQSGERHVIGYLLVCPETPTELGDLAKRVDLSTFSSLSVAKWLLGAQGSAPGTTDRGQHRELLSYAMFHPDFHVEAISLGDCDATRELDAVGPQQGNWRTEPLT